jgi:hypothetical protein
MHLGSFKFIKEKHDFAREKLASKTVKGLSGKGPSFRNDSNTFVRLEKKVFVEILNGESYKKVPDYYVINPYLNHPITDIIGYSQTV